MEARIQQLEQLVGQLREGHAALSVSVEAFERSTAKLEASVERLTEAMNKMSGAMWAVSVVATLVGAVIGFGVAIWSASKH